MEQIIKYLQELLKAEKFVITGSYALQKMGFIQFTEISDLDILLYNPSPETKVFLEALDVLKNHDSDYGNEQDQYQIQLPQLDQTLVKVDVWVLSDTQMVSRKVEILELSDGLCISTLPGIIAAKKRYKTGRNAFKHLIQRKQMAEKIYTPGEFEEFVKSEEKKYREISMKDLAGKGGKKTPFQKLEPNPPTVEQWREALMLFNSAMEIKTNPPPVGVYFDDEDI